MVYISESTKRLRWSKAQTWLGSKENTPLWKEDDISFSNKVYYYVPDVFTSADVSRIDHPKALELMRAQGWKQRKIKDDQSLASHSSIIVEPSIECIDVAAWDVEMNPLVKFDQVTKYLRGVLVENIEYSSKNDRIEELEREVIELSQENKRLHSLLRA
jgi:hypothetical protein